MPFTFWVIFSIPSALLPLSHTFYGTQEDLRKIISANSLSLFISIPLSLRSQDFFCGCDSRNKSKQKQTPYAMKSGCCI